MKSSIDEKLQGYRLSLSNALGYVPLKKPLATFSYDRPKLLKGQSLLEKVLELQSTKDDTYGAQKDATDAINQEWATLKTLFNEHRQLARLAFKDQRGVLTQLKLDTRLKTAFSGWITQATAFYGKIGQHSEGMARYGVNTEVLHGAQSRLEALLGLYSQQSQRKAEAQHITEQRNKALKDLDHWMRDFYRIAKVALQDEPQLLEMLGYVVPAQA
ncbi:MAG: hypothetical protein RIG62_13310 [Cyclobacteriaceae bacterium]